MGARTPYLITRANESSRETINILGIFSFSRQNRQNVVIAAQPRQLCA
jgi:hypothetical protein